MKWVRDFVFWWLLASICSAQAPNFAQSGHLTHDLTVGASNDVQLKAGQTVKVLSQSENTAVIMVQLSDDSNGVYQVTSKDIDLTQTNSLPDAATAVDQAATTSDSGSISPTSTSTPDSSLQHPPPASTNLPVSSDSTTAEARIGKSEQECLNGMTDGGTRTDITAYQTQYSSRASALEFRFGSTDDEIIKMDFLDNKCIYIEITPYTEPETSSDEVATLTARFAPLVARFGPLQWNTLGPDWLNNPKVVKDVPLLNVWNIYWRTADEHACWALVRYSGGGYAADHITLTIHEGTLRDIWMQEFEKGYRQASTSQVYP